MDLYSENVSFGAGVIIKNVHFLSCCCIYSSIVPAIIYDLPERGIAPTNIFFSSSSMSLLILDMNNFW